MVVLQCDYLMDVASAALRNELTSAELQEKETFRKKLERRVQAIIADYAKDNVTINPKNVKLKCYGSLASGFGIQGSDMDLLLMFPKNEGPIGPIEVEGRRMMERAFLDMGYGARLLTQTRVPILRVCSSPSWNLLENLRRYRMKWEEDEKQAENARSRLEHKDSNRLPECSQQQVTVSLNSFAELDVSPAEIALPPSPTREQADLEYRGDVGIQCDINFSNYVAIYNTALLRCYCRCDPRVREMGLFVKAWAKARKINTPYYGTLSSYGYIMMVLHYLINIARPPVTPNLQHMKKDEDAWNNKTDVELFDGFDIRFENNEEKITRAARSGKITENRENLGSLIRGFFRYYADHRGFHWTNEVISIRTVGGILTKKSKNWTESKWSGDSHSVRLRYFLAIEDPFEIDHNVARTVGHSGVVAIRDEFRRAWDIINKIELVPGEGWKWRKTDGSIGEGLLDDTEDRGDLLKKDKDYYLEKMKSMREMVRARAEAANAEVANSEECNAGDGGGAAMECAKSGTSSISRLASFGRRASETTPTSDPSNTRLIPELPIQQKNPRQRNGRLRTVRQDSNGSISDVGGKEVLRITDAKDSMKENIAPEFPIENSTPSSEFDASNTKARWLCLEDVTLPQRVGENGKLTAWDVTTRAGNWLAWRDRKVRAGEWNSSRKLHPWDHMFPFDPLRPLPDAGQQRRNVLIRERRNAFYAKDCGTPTAITKGNQAVKVPGQAQLPNTAEPASKNIEPKRKDSAVSGLGLKGPICKDEPKASGPTVSSTQPPAGTRSGIWRSTPPNWQQHSPHIQLSTQTHVASTTSMGTPKVPIPPSTLTNITTASSSLSPQIPQTQTTTLTQSATDPPREEDPKIMPVPTMPGFQFDPRQLRDLDIIRKGGNGCARRGEEFDVELEGEWGGGGWMGKMLSSATGVMQSSGDAYVGGKGDEDGLLAELPGEI